MKKILDFFRKRKKGCIIFSAVLVVVIVAVVVVAVNIPYDEENAAELNAALHQAETSDVQDQDNEGVNAEPDTGADVTETAETGQESADSNAAGQESSVNTAAILPAAVRVLTAPDRLTAPTPCSRRRVQALIRLNRKVLRTVTGDFRISIFGRIMLQQSLL